MTAEDYWTFWESKSGDDVEYQFPEFTSEYTTSLNGILKDMGMEDAFDASRADFGNMSNLKPLFISDVVHKTKIEVNAMGTRAAATTAVVVDNESCAIAGEEVHITLDQPFVYMIIDNSTGLPTFMGVCNDIVK